MPEPAGNVHVRVQIKRDVGGACTGGYLPQYMTNATYSIAEQKKEEPFKPAVKLTFSLCFSELVHASHGKFWLLKYSTEA